MAGLSFLWHLSGSIALDDVTTNDAVLDQVEVMLRGQWKPIAERGADFVAFTDPLWRIFKPNWLAMVIYDEGVFWVAHGPKGRRLRYRLRSLHGLVFCLFAALTAFLFGLSHVGFVEGLRVGAIAFGVLYGGNVLLALIRVPLLVDLNVFRAQRS